MEPTYPAPSTTKTVESVEVHPKKPERKAAAANADAEPKKAAMSIEEQRAAMEAKIANMDPEKAAKVRANFESKIAKLQSEQG